MIYTVYSLLKENKLFANFSEKRNMETHVDSTSNDMQSATERWKKAVLNLQNRLQDFKDDLARTENMFEKTKEDIQLAQSRADRNRQFLKKDTANDECEQRGKPKYFITRDSTTSENRLCCTSGNSGCVHSLQDLKTVLFLNNLNTACD